MKCNQKLPALFLILPAVAMAAVAHTPAPKAPYQWRYNSRVDEIHAVKNCSGLTSKEVKLNQEVIRNYEMQFCCDCAQRAVSYYEHENPYPNSYTLFTFRYRKLRDIDDIIRDRLNPLQQFHIEEIKIGCGRVHHHWVFTVPELISGKLVACLIKDLGYGKLGVQNNIFYESA